MKKSIVTILFSVITLFSFAKDHEEGVSGRVLNKFNREYASAKTTSWEVSKNFVKVTFIMNEQVLFAYYSPEGEKLAVSRNLLPAQLPLVLSTKLKSAYPNRWITDLFEITVNNETSYYVTVEDADSKITLKSEGTLGWELFQKKLKD